MNAAYWREYRRKNRERLNRQQAARRRKATPAQRQRRYRAELDRQRRRRAEAQPYIEMPIPGNSSGHDLYKQLSTFLPHESSPGTYYRFPAEMDREDAFHEGVVALLEGGDPSAAIKCFLSRERFLRVVDVCLPADGLIDAIGAFQNRVLTIGGEAS